MSDLAVVDAEAEWHAFRGKGIGGSDIAALLGLSNYSSPVSLYYEKIGLIEPTPESRRQRLGKNLEAALALEFHDDTGLFVVGAQTWCVHPDYPHFRCTVDGFAGESPETSIDAVLGTVQMKSDGRFGWPDGVPSNIRAQCIWEMGVTGVRHCWLVVIFAGLSTDVFEIGWDADAEADWAYMVKVADAFWRDNVVAGVVPPMDEHAATTSALTEVYRDPEGMVDADAEARVLVANVRIAMARTKAAEAEEVRTKNDLRSYLGDHTDLIDGWTVPGPRSKSGPKPIVLASWREQTSRRPDLDALRAADPELVAQHMNESTSRVLRVSKLKED